MTTTLPPPEPPALTTTELAQVLRLVLAPAEADIQLSRIAFAYTGRPEAERTALAVIAQRATTELLRRSLINEHNQVRPDCGDAMRTVASVWENEHAGPGDDTRVLRLAFDALMLSDSVRTWSAICDQAASHQPSSPLALFGVTGQPDEAGDKLSTAAALAARALQGALLLAHMDTANPDAPVDEAQTADHLATCAASLSAAGQCLLQWGYPRGYVRVAHGENCDGGEGCPGGPHIG